MLGFVDFIWKPSVTCYVFCKSDCFHGRPTMLSGIITNSWFLWRYGHLQQWSFIHHYSMLVILDGTEGLFSKGLTSSYFAKFILVHPQLMTEKHVWLESKDIVKLTPEHCYDVFLYVSCVKRMTSFNVISWKQVKSCDNVVSKNLNNTRWFMWMMATYRRRWQYASIIDDTWKVHVVI